MALTTKEFADRPALKGWGLAGVALLVIVLIALMAKGCGGEEPLAADQSSAPSTSSTPTGKGSVLPQVPGLHRSPSDPDWLTGAPHRISWQRVDGIPFPFSDSDGPTRIDGAVATGYSHTPQGAVLAAAHISFRLAWSPDFEAVLDAQARVDERTRAALIEGRTRSGNVDPAMVAAVAKAPVAFKVTEYSDTKAVVFLAFPTSTNVYRVAPVAVVWDDGDWRYSDALNADEAKELSDTDNLDAEGFTSLEEEEK